MTSSPPALPAFPELPQNATLEEQNIAKEIFRGDFETYLIEAEQYPPDRTNKETVDWILEHRQLILLTDSGKLNLLNILDILMNAIDKQL